MNAIGIIPARYASMRFPGKCLVEIEGKPLVQDENVEAMSADEVGQETVKVNRPAPSTSC